MFVRLLIYQKHKRLNLYLQYATEFIIVKATDGRYNFIVLNNGMNFLWGLFCSTNTIQHSPSKLF